MIVFARRFVQKAGMLVALTALTIAACQSQNVDTDLSVVSTLSGRITVSAEVDTVADYSGFSVIVGREGADGVDTLGFALTTSDGRFRHPCRALRAAEFIRSSSLVKDRFCTSTRS
jgi:hypothetical protein